MKKLTNFVAFFCSILLLCVAMTGNNILADGKDDDGIVWVEPTPPIHPEEGHFYYPLNALEKLVAFFGQTDPDGVENGTNAIGYYYPGLSYPTGISPVLWDYVTDTENPDCYYAYRVGIYNWYLWGGWDLRYIDYYGELDLENTTVTNVEMDGCHLSSVNLNNCTHLGGIRLNVYDYYCSTVSAVNADLQVGEITLQSGVKRMALGMRYFDSQVNISVVGNGCVGIEFENKTAVNAKAKLQTKPLDSQEFVGWFKEGHLVSTDTVLNITEGGNYIASFAGDVTNDGCLNVADAVQLMREALGLVETRDVAMSDINCDGSVGINDAVLLLRAVMGI